MPRAARHKSETGIYHVILRAANQQMIFKDEEDKERFLYCLEESKKLSKFELYAYVLLGNEVHLLIKEGEETLAQAFRRLGARFVYWYNQKYERSGHLFQDRYKSIPVEDVTYFTKVLRYIYLKPVQAKLCKIAEDFQWSSFRLLKNTSAIIDHEQLFEIIPLDTIIEMVNDRSDNKQLFLEFSEKKRIGDHVAARIIKKECKLNDLQEFQTLGEREQTRYLKKLLGGNISVRQLVRLTGLSRSKVEGLIKAPSSSSNRGVTK